MTLPYVKSRSYSEHWHSTIPHKVQKRLCNGDSIVRRRRPLHAILVHLIREDSNRMSVEQDFGDNLFRKLGMALHRDVASGRVEALNLADFVGSEGD